METAQELQAFVEELIDLATHTSRLGRENLHAPQPERVLDPPSEAAPWRTPTEYEMAAINVADAAGAQIEQLHRIQFAGRGPVAAFDVVGINLQLGLGREIAIIRQQQRVAGHAGIGQLSDLTNIDLPLEHPAPPAGCNITERFRCSRVGHMVGDA